jgi:hypothetical protein
LVDLGKGMACKGRCEADVRGLITMNEINLAITAKVPRQLRANRLAYSLMGWFLAGAGSLFVLLGALDRPPSSFLLVTGGFFLFFGLLCKLALSRMPRFEAAETGEHFQPGSRAENPR